MFVVAMQEKTNAKQLVEALNEKPEMIQASYKPDWNKEKGGTIHLDGEMDFPRNQNIEDVYESLHQRAMQVGGIVASNKDKTKIKVSTQFGACKFVLMSNEPDEPVQKIKSIDKHEDKERTDTMEELIAMGQESKEIMDFVEEQIEKGNMSIEIEKDNERQNIMEM